MDLDQFIDPIQFADFILTTMKHIRGLGGVPDSIIVSDAAYVKLTNRPPSQMYGKEHPLAPATLNGIPLLSSPLLKMDAFKITSCFDTPNSDRRFYE